MSFPESVPSGHGYLLLARVNAHCTVFYVVSVNVLLTRILFITNFLAFDSTRRDDKKHTSQRAMETLETPQEVPFRRTRYTYSRVDENHKSLHSEEPSRTVESHYMVNVDPIFSFTPYFKASSSCWLCNYSLLVQVVSHQFLTAKEIAMAESIQRISVYSSFKLTERELISTNPE